MKEMRSGVDSSSLKDSPKLILGVDFQKIEYRRDKLIQRHTTGLNNPVDLFISLPGHLRVQ